jgi:hypothetical protein
MSNNENAPPGVTPNGQGVPQQQPSPSQAQNNVQALAQTSVGGDSLTCQWQNCGERCTTAEQLYVSASHSSGLDRQGASFNPHSSIYLLSLSLSANA